MRRIKTAMTIIAVFVLVSASTFGVAHAKGIKCTNGGLVSMLVTGLVANHYLEQGDPTKADEYLRRALSPEEYQQYQNIPEATKQEQIVKGKTLLAGYKASGADFVNFHWYNADTPALEEAINFLQGASQLTAITNEVGQHNEDPQQVTDVMGKIVELNIPNAVWFSVDSNKARALMDTNGNLRPNGEAFKQFIEGMFIKGDIDGDGDVDIFDYNLLITNFGRTSGTPTPTSNPSSSTPTKTPTPTVGVSITPPPGGQGIWISPQRLASLPTSGSAWNNVKSAADSSAGTPDLANQDDSTNVIIMAKALVYARTGQVNYRNDVLSALLYIANSGQYSGRALALGRELAAYVISADLINLKSVDPSLDSKFRAKIRELLTTPTSGGPGSLVECHEDRPNNWGTHCGDSRAAVAAYLGDTQELARVAQVFKG